MDQKTWRKNPQYDNMCAANTTPPKAAWSAQRRMLFTGTQIKVLKIRMSHTIYGHYVDWAYLGPTLDGFPIKSELPTTPPASLWDWHKQLWLTCSSDHLNRLIRTQRKLRNNDLCFGLSDALLFLLALQSTTEARNNLCGRVFGSLWIKSCLDWTSVLSLGGYYFTHDKPAWGKRRPDGLWVTQ